MTTEARVKKLSKEQLSIVVFLLLALVILAASAVSIVHMNSTIADMNDAGVDVISLANTELSNAQVTALREHAAQLVIGAQTLSEAITFLAVSMFAACSLLLAFGFLNFFAARQHAKALGNALRKSEHAPATQNAVRTQNAPQLAKTEDADKAQVRKAQEEFLRGTHRIIPREETLRPDAENVKAQLAPAATKRYERTQQDMQKPLGVQKPQDTQKPLSIQKPLVAQKPQDNDTVQEKKNAQDSKAGTNTPKPQSPEVSARVEQQLNKPESSVQPKSRETSPESKRRNKLKANAEFSDFYVLLVDDVAINREIVLSMLEPMGVSIDCAQDGEEALQIFTKNPLYYDLIFMDIQMPNMDGYEATRQIRNSGVSQAKTVPIIAMTTQALPEDVAMALESGMNAHVKKPISLDELLRTLREYL